MGNASDYAVPPPPRGRGRNASYVGCGCLAISLLVLLLIGSCAAYVYNQSKQVGEELTQVGDVFFTAWDAEDFATISGMMAPNAVDPGSEQALVEGLARMRETLGPVKSRTGVRFEIHTTSDQRTALIGYRVRFEEGPGEVQLSLEDEDGEWRIASVEIDADDLIGPTACPSCGHVNAPGSRFCSECGAPLDAPAETSETETVQI